MPYTDTISAFVVALSAVARQAARVFGLLILSLSLRHQMSGLWELWAFWSSLTLVTGSFWLHICRAPPSRSDFLPFLPLKP